MKVTVNGTTHDVAMDSMPFDEACEIEDVTGQTITEWAAALSKGSAKACRALALVLAKRADPSVRWSDIGQMDFGKFIQELRESSTEDGDSGDAVPQADPTPAAAEPAAEDTSV